jgi:serine/threonine protein kinase
MVAGVRPFPGQYDQALAYEIVNQDPEPVTSVRAGVPMELEFIVDKCLQKDHSKRYDHASELEKDLRSVSDKLRSARSTATRTNTKVFGPIVPPIKTASEHDGPSVVLRKRLPWAIASVAVLASLMVTFDAADRPAREGLQASFEVHGPAAVGIVGGTVSPDGKILGYRPFDDVSRIWLRGLDDRPIKTIDGYPRELSWSPDSKALAFISGGAIKRFELAEDQPRMLCDACDLPREITAGTAWSRDGQIYIGFLDGPMRKISTGGGLLTEALPLEEGELSQQFPAVLPDGENVLYVSIRKDPGAKRHLLEEPK